MAFINAVGNALEVRRSDVERVDTAAGGIYTCRMQFQTGGYGETTVPLSFPVTYVELPSVHSGWSMLPNQALNSGGYPVVHCGVYHWNYSYRVDNGFPNYFGCVLALVVTGDPNLNLVHHVTFIGKAVRNPVQ